VFQFSGHSRKYHGTDNSNEGNQSRRFSGGKNSKARTCICEAFVNVCVYPGSGMRTVIWISAAETDCVARCSAAMAWIAPVCQSLTRRETSPETLATGLT